MLLKKGKRIVVSYLFDLYTSKIFIELLSNRENSKRRLEVFYLTCKNIVRKMSFRQVGILKKGISHKKNIIISEIDDIIVNNVIYFKG